LRQFLDAGDSVYRGRIENRIRHRNSLPSSVEAWTTAHWTVVIPAEALAGGIGSVIVIGAIAGLIPALHAARLSPTEALRTA
jgi:ABC-type antimicrobial peptide transport system permease subunit